MNQIVRGELIDKLEDSNTIWDLIIVGGGATGLGTAVDAASRGYKTLLLEQADFAKGTSSRSTKLVHGGVRYLAQGNIGLVIEALRERGLLLKNAAHLVKNELFIIPNYNWWGGAFYTIGLTVYDLLAGKLGFGRVKYLTKKEVQDRLPNLKSAGLNSGVSYHDGQFDDSRLAINLAQTAIEQGATVLNYVKVINLRKNGQRNISGVLAQDIETRKTYFLYGRSVINATGIFVDELLEMDKPGARPIVRPSQGVHLVLDASFLPGQDALMIPETEDGRVLFAVPWHNRVVVGTTDTPVNEHTLEPVALHKEVEFIIRTVGKYLIKSPVRSDALSVYAGLRPLAASENDESKTKEISRSHKLIIADSGLITIIGGKWTTYRKMGEDTVNKAIVIGKLKPEPNKTKTLSIHGNQNDVNRADHLYVYGSDRASVLDLIGENPDWHEQLDPRLPYIKAEVIWGVRFEMARTVEDILARRMRALFLDARAAIDMAGPVANLMRTELRQTEKWENDQVIAFKKLAENYLLNW